MAEIAPARVEAPLATVAREWTRIGVTGFGGPPAHIALLRKLVVDRERWMDHHEFEDANAACSLLPGPSSTQLAIFCAYRVAGWPGAIVGGLGFIVPAVVLILALSVVFLSGSPPDWIRGAGAGAGAVPRLPFRGCAGPAGSGTVLAFRRVSRNRINPPRPSGMQARDASEPTLRVDGVVSVAAHHPAATYDLAELHGDEHA